MNAPTHLPHKPIVQVGDYDKIDGVYAKSTNAQALSVGLAHYDHGQISVKIWRTDKNGDWSIGSEEMPIHRALDLSILIVASILSNSNANYSLTSLREEVVEPNNLQKLKDYYKNNEHLLRPRLQELQKIIDVFFKEESNINSQNKI